mmetsp:Transcript_48928/g.72724  ORF Transcript_48928/g.72724 Transcript_48928/m.72724 type:complete len:194 (+) Transcript_48928:64-645(+)|eukprot:CAMPEP_0195523446 /NCGR_PEP_ID=MMETSP0794_2-20130614/22660_1 /TAXON_ID=515487 /ORGANISM="Stephanopyxis turris, Strain CCMP 815" /LENGTH=193 /DNA_ID=CAMNT_0040653451 /DNA_START=58 /DNA_END=636 /DNA_ORIENTATION=+
MTLCKPVSRREHRIFYKRREYFAPILICLLLFTSASMSSALLLPGRPQLLLSSRIARHSTSYRHDRTLFYTEREQNAHSLLHATNKNSDNENNFQASLDDQLDRIDAFLDKPFFDPDSVLDEDDGDGDGSPLGKFRKWFATLVKNDYDFAEALYAGFVLVFMVVVSQELLRMQLYGSNYIPFTPGGAGDVIRW